MPIRFQCSTCGAGFKAGNEQSGQQLPCPKCGSTLQVPVAQATLAPHDDPLDETESAGLAETQVNPLAGVAKKVEQRRQHAVPPPPPAVNAAQQPTRESPPPNAFQSPLAPTESPRDLDLTRVKITDIDVPFWSLFKLAFKVWLCALVFGFLLWAIAAVVSAVILALAYSPGMP